MPAAKGSSNSAKTSHKGAGGGSTGIPARGAGNRTSQAKNVSKAMKSQNRQGATPNKASAVKGTTGGRSSSVTGNRGKGTGR